ncbi:MAG TPA: rhomboid family intramembrane serine protease [Balneolales bacterium]|nr:rhomboid family intramembrane serine protease [Balneolales bacterium]
MKKFIPYGTTILVSVSVIFFLIARIDTIWSEKLIGYFWYDMLPIHQGEIWRMLFGPFIHFEISHFLGNTIFLAYFGYKVELKYGPKILLLVFFLSNIIGFALIYLFYGYTGVFGISGSVCGLYGFLLLTLDRKKTLWKNIKSYWVFVLYAVLLVMLAIAPGGLDMLHLFGIVVGLMLGFTVIPKYKIKILRYCIPIITLLAVMVLAFNPFSTEWDITYKNHDAFTIVEPNTCHPLPDSLGQELTKHQSILLSLAGSDIYVINATSEPKQVIFMGKQSAPQYAARIAPHSFSMTTLKSNIIQFRTNSGKCAEIIIPDKHEKDLLVDLKRFRL